MKGNGDGNWVSVPKPKIEEIFGKDVAQKIIDGQGDRNTKSFTPFTELKGDNLKVGGEGMKGFYDKILPEYATRYAKKWGVKVGETRLSGKLNPAADPKLFGRHDLGRMGVLMDAEDNFGFDTTKQARDAIAAHPDWEQRWEGHQPGTPRPPSEIPRSAHASDHRPPPARHARHARECDAGTATLCPQESERNPPASG